MTTSTMPRRYIIILILFFSWVFIYFQRVNISILLVDAKFLLDMGLTGKPAAQGLLMTLFLLAYSFSNMVSSTFISRIGPTYVLLIGIAIATISMIGAGFAAGFLILLGARILLGVGQGLYFPAQSVLVRNWFPPDERGKANSLYAIGGCIGPLIAMPLFTYLTGYGWPLSFWVAAACGAFIVVPILMGRITDDYSTNKYISAEEKAYLAASYQNDTTLYKAADLYRAVLTNKNFWIVCLSYLAMLSIWWGLLTWLPQYLMIARGFSLKSLGWAASLPYVLATIGILLGGYYSDRFGKRAIFGTIALFSATFCIIAGATTESRYLSVILLALGAGMNQVYYAPSWSLLQNLLPDHLVGTGSGLMNGISNFISGMAPFIIGFLIQITGNYVAGLFYLASLAFIGGIATLLLVKRSM